MLVIIVNGLSTWPAYYAVGAEVSSLDLRDKSQGLGWGFNNLSSCVFSVALPYVYNFDAGDLRGKTGFIYAGLCAVGVVASWYMVPEMKDLKTEEIDALFERSQ